MAGANLVASIGGLAKQLRHAADVFDALLVDRSRETPATAARIARAVTQRPQMSVARRRAISRRQKAYWRKRKAAAK